MPRPRVATDQQIIAGTIAAIGKHGPAKLTLAHVADEVGITPAALVRRFGSKAGLLAAVAADAADYADSAFDEAARVSASPVDALLGGLASFAGDIKTRTELANHLAMLQLDIADPTLREQAARQARTVLDRIGALLSDAADAGQLSTDDPALLADAIYTTYSGALITWAIDGRGDLGGWIRQKVENILQPYRHAP